MLRERSLISRADRTPDSQSGPVRPFWTEKLAEVFRKALRTNGDFRLRRTRGYVSVRQPK
jgi:hypothetical protein